MKSEFQNNSAEYARSEQQAADHLVPAVDTDKLRMPLSSGILYDPETAISREEAGRPKTGQEGQFASNPPPATKLAPVRVPPLSSELLGDD